MADFTDYDYNAVVQKMTDLLKEQPGWGDGFDSSMGQTLIQLMADVTDNLHYMLERRTRENYLQTASLRSSVLYRATELGYRPRRIKGNSGTLRLTLTDQNGNTATAVANVIVPVGTAVIKDNVTYTVVEEAVIPSGQTNTEVNIVQGSLIEQTFQLVANQNEILLRENVDSIENSFFRVFSQNAEFFDVADHPDVNKRALSFLEENDAYYDIRYVSNGLRVLFGTNGFGQTPFGNVTVQFLETQENVDPIKNLEQDFGFTSQTVNDVNNLAYFYRLRNITPVEGGRSPESIESIKRNAPTFHKTNGRAITNSDFEYWVRRSGIGNIVDVKVYGEYELNTLVYNINNVYITYVTESGAELTQQEKQDLLSYLDKVKSSFVHVVLIPANKLFIKAEMEIRRDPQLPIPNSELYRILREFLINEFRLERGSIGGFIHNSDIVHNLYNQRIIRDGIEYSLVDFVRLKLYGGFPFNVPLRSNSVLIQIGPDYTPVDGHEFVLHINNIMNYVLVEDGDTIPVILEKMKDRINEVTPFEARLIIGSIAVDDEGNPIPIEVNTQIGTQVGSSLVDVVIESDEITVQHYYYSSLAGRRPIIPLRIGTEVTFTAPSDTSVNVYTRLDITDPGSETLFATLAPDEAFNETFAAEHGLIFEYVDNSFDDRIVTIDYPSFDLAGVGFGINVRTKDGFGTFDVRTNSGDVTSVTVDFNVSVPVDQTIEGNKMLPSTVQIIRQSDGSLFYTDNGNGKFLDVFGSLVPTGDINYNTGFVNFPDDIPDGSYYLFYEQNRFGNFVVDERNVIQLLPPKLNIGDADEISTINII